jgi:hypothetical protein
MGLAEPEFMECAAEPPHSPLMFASLRIGHHFSSQLCGRQRAHQDSAVLADRRSTIPSRGIEVAKVIGDIPQNVNFAVSLGVYRVNRGTKFLFTISSS